MEVLGIGEVALSPYQNRHGGASRDHLLRLRTVAAIQRRGRWAAECQDLRQARALTAGFEQARSRPPGLWRNDPKRLWPLLPREIVPDAQRAGEKVVPAAEGKSMLSLFGGASGPAKAWVAQGGEALVVDIAGALENDLSKPSRWNLLASQVHTFDCVGIDLPCNTWSRGRRAPKHSRFPQPLRGDIDEEIFGLPGLKKGDFEKVKNANQMMWGAYKLIRRALRSGVCGYLENPLTSRLWKLPCTHRSSGL